MLRLLPALILARSAVVGGAFFGGALVGALGVATLAAACRARRDSHHAHEPPAPAAATHEPAASS